MWEGSHVSWWALSQKSATTPALSTFREGDVMKKRQHILVAVTAATSLFALAACGGGSGNEASTASFDDEVGGVLHIWGFNNADDVGQSRLDYAAAQMPDVQIVSDSGGFDAQKFTALAASGGLPDAVQMGRDFVGTYAAKGLIMSLDDCFDLVGVDPSEHYYSHVIDEVTYDGSVWAVPQFYQPAAIMLNMRVLEAAGVTKEEFDTSKPEVLLAAVKKLYKETDGNASTLGFDPRMTGQAAFWMLAFGGALMDSDGKPTLDDPNNVKAIEYIKELMDAQGGFAEVKSFIDTFDFFGGGNQFATDQVAAQVIEQWYVNVVAGTRDDVEISAVPMRDRDGNPIAFASGTAFVVPKAAKNPAAACQWMIHLTSDEGWMAAGDLRAANILADGNRLNTGLFTGSPSADQAIREKHVVPTGFPGFDEAIETYYSVASEGRHYGTSPAGQEIKVELETAVTAALLGEKSAEQALADAQAAALRAYESR